METTSPSWLDIALFAGLHALAAAVLAGLLGFVLTGRAERDEG